MLPTWARQLFRQKFQGRGTVAPYRNGLSVEALEDRSLMTTATWTGLATPLTGVTDYTWGNALNWANNYRPGDDGDGVPDDVLFPAIANGLAKPNAAIVNNAFVWNPNSIIDGDYQINDLRIEGDNYFITSLATQTLTLDGRLLVNFAGPVGTVTGMSLLGPRLTAAQPISSLRIVLNDNVTTNPGFGPANQFVNSNTGELYVTATLTDGFTPSTGTVRPSGLIKNGTGTISLAGNNTFTGVTSVQSGILIAASDGALGASTAQTLVSNGATIGVSGGTIGDALQLLGAGVGGRGALRGIADSFTTFRGGSSGGGTWAGGISVLGDATIGTDFNLAITTNGIGGTGNITKVGFAQLDLVVDSTYSGNTLITEGGVSIFTDNALAPGFQTVVSSEATLNLDGGLSVSETLVLAGDGSNNYNDGFGRPAGALTLRPVNAGGNSTWLGSITLTSPIGASIGALGGSTLTLGGPLVAPATAPLAKVERGRVRITRSNQTTFLSTTRIDNGTVEIADAKALGSGLITVNATTGAQPAIGTLQIEAPAVGTPLTLTNPLALNGAGDGNAGAVHVVAPAGSGALGSSSVTLSGSMVLNSTTNLNVDPRSTMTVTGVISDVAAAQAPELNKLGGGTLVLSATNTYRGLTVLRDGVTSITSARGLGTTAAGTSVNTGAVLSLDGGSAGLTVSGESLSVAGSAGFAPSTLRAGSGTNVWAGSINFVDNQGAPVNVEAAAGATLELRSGAQAGVPFSLGGAAAIQKVGAGTVSLTGTTANTLTGTISVNAGVLALGNTGGNATNGAVVVGDRTGAGTDELRLLAPNQLSDSQSVTVNTTGLFNLNGFSDTIGGNPTALTVAGGRVQTGAGVLSLNGDVNAFGAGTTTNVDGNIDGNVFLTATRTFLFRPTPQLSIQSLVNSSEFGETATFVVTAFPFTSGALNEPAPTGTITFFDGDTRIGSVQALQPAGGVGPNTTAAIGTTTLSGGLHTIRAEYSGDQFYAPTSVTMTQQQAVRNTPVFATLRSSNLTAEPNPNLPVAPTPAQSVTFTYRATAPVGSVAPTGTVTFFDNGVAIAPATTLTADGFASVTTSFPVPTTAAERYRTITATYSGDLFFSANTVTLSAPVDPTSVFTRPVSQQVGFVPLVQLTSDQNAAAGVRSPTVTAQVNGASGQPVPAGTVQFFLDGASVGQPVTVDPTGKASFTLGVPTALVASASWAAGTATVTTTLPHNLETGDRATVAGVTIAGYNGTFTVTRISATSFSYTVADPGANTAPTAGGATISNASWSGGRAVITTTTRVNVNTGGTLTIAGLTPAGYNGTYRVTALDFSAFLGGATQFSYELATSPGTFLAGNVRRVGYDVSAASWNNGVATVTTNVAHRLSTGDTVSISGLNPDPYNGLYVVTVINANSFSYSLPRPTDPGVFITGGVVLRTGAAITTAAWAGGVVTATTTAPHNLETGDQVTLTGITRPAYNGTFFVTRVSDTQFSYALADDPGAFVTNNPLPAVNATISTMVWNPNTDVVTVTTTAPNTFQSGDVVSINAGNTASAAGGVVPASAAAFNGSFVITRVNATTFTYPMQLDPGQYISAVLTPAAQAQLSRTVTAASWDNGNGGQITINTNLPHNLIVGNTVVLSNLRPPGYNGTYQVIAVNNSASFTVQFPPAVVGGPTQPITTNPGTYISPTVTNTAGGLQSVITNASWVGNVATITTANAHGLVTGQTATISNVNPAGYNTGGPVTVTVLNGNTFSYQLNTDPGPFLAPTSVGSISVPIQNASWTGGTTTVNTTGPHNLSTGQVISIRGASPNTYNVTNVTITVTSPTQFTYAQANDPGPFFQGTSNGTASRAATTASNTFATATPAGLAVGAHSVRAEFRSTDAVYTDSRATYSVPTPTGAYTANLTANTPVVYELQSSRTAVQLSSIGGDDPVIQDPASFTFRVNTNDAVNYQNPLATGALTPPTPPRVLGQPGNTFHPTPTGTVRFEDSAGRILGTFAVGTIDGRTGVPGEATITGVTFPRSLFAAGTATITAIYSGDRYYAGQTLTVVQGLLAVNTAVKLSTNRSVAAIGEQVEFTVDASTLAAMNVPTIGAGFVNLTTTNTTTGLAGPGGQFNLNNRGVRGVGVGTLTFTTPGTYTVTAQFVNTTNAIGGATVTLAPNLIVRNQFDAVLTSDRAPAAPAGSNVTFTFRATGLTNTTVPPSGTVQFYDGINQIGTTQILSAAGTASITLSTLPTGTRTISAVFTPPNGSPYQVTRVFMDQVQVIGTPPVLDIDTDVGAAVFGEAVTINVNVRGSLGTAAGRVDLFDNGLPLATGVLVRNGVASFTTSGLTAGRHTIDVRYSGDVNYAPAVGTMTQDLLVISPTRFQVRSSANPNVNGSAIDYPAAAGATVTYTAELRTNSVAPNNPLPDATGSVTFDLVDANNTVVASTGPLALTTVVVVIDANTTLRTPTVSGTLTAPAFNPAPGANNTYRVVARYSGDRNYSPQAAAFSQPVVANAGALPLAAPAPTTAPRLVPTLNVNGGIQGGPSTGIISSASGTLALNGPSTYGGSTVITGAGNTVRLGVNDALPNTTPVTVTAGTLNANGQTDVIGSLSGTGTVNLPAGSLLTAGGLNTTTTFTGAIAGDNNPATVDGTLRKVGTGALTLAGTDGGFSGVVDTAGGTVFLNTALPNANATVQSGAILGGTGTARNVSVSAGGRLAPAGTVANANTVGVLNGTGNLVLAAGAQFAVDVLGAGPAGNTVTGYDQFATAGTASLGGATLSLNLAYAPAIGDAFTVLTAGGGVTGKFGAVVVNNATVALAANDTFVLNNRVYQITYGANNVVVAQIGLNSAATLTSSVNPSSPGQSVTFAVTITPSLGTDPTPVGNVQFFVNGVATGAPVPVAQVGATNAAQATFTTTTLAVGPNTITATFTPGGGSTYQARTQAELTVTQRVSVTSTTTLVAQQGPVVFGDAVSFLAGVPQQSGLPIPTGTFTLVNAATGATLATGGLDGTGRAILSPATFPAGTVQVQVNYSGDNFYRASVSNVVTQVVDRRNFIVVGSDAGPVATVQVYDPRLPVGSPPSREFRPFDGYTLGVKVATGDVNGDGVSDIVVSAGAGAPGGHVRVFDGVSFNEIASFFTFIGYTGGVNIAVGDVDGDGFGDVVVGTSVDNDHVKAFSGRLLLSGSGIAANGTADPSTVQSFFAYGGGNTVGVTVGTGDVDGDGRADVITGSALRAGHVKAFQGGTSAQIGSYFAYGQGYLGGIFVAGGDLDGDGRAEVITGATNAPHVKALKADSGAEVASFFAYKNPDGSPAPFGVRVGAIDRNGNRLADILTGSGGSAPAVKVFDGLNLNAEQLIDSFISNPTGQAPSTSGVFVGGNTK